MVRNKHGILLVDLQQINLMVTLILVIVFLHYSKVKVVIIS